MNDGMDHYAPRMIRVDAHMIVFGIVFMTGRELSRQASADSARPEATVVWGVGGTLPKSG
jgi:hypothetical protein